MGSSPDPSEVAGWKVTQSPPRGCFPGYQCTRKSYQSKRNDCRWRCRCLTSSGGRSPEAAWGACWEAGSRLFDQREEASPGSATAPWRPHGRQFRAGLRSSRSKWWGGCQCCSLIGWCLKYPKSQICCDRHLQRTDSMTLVVEHSEHQCWLILNSWLLLSGFYLCCSGGTAYSAASPAPGSHGSASPLNSSDWRWGLLRKENIQVITPTGAGRVYRLLTSSLT